VNNILLGRYSRRRFYSFLYTWFQRRNIIFKKGKGIFSRIFEDELIEEIPG